MLMSRCRFTWMEPTRRRSTSSPSEKESGMPPRPNAASTTSDRELTITRIFDAPRELVFRAWTEPAHLARWWGPRGYTLPSCQLDLRPGGAYSFEMHAPDGAIRIWHGVVRE